jgi:hypothetical protein
MISESPTPYIDLTRPPRTVGGPHILPWPLPGAPKLHPWQADPEVKEVVDLLDYYRFAAQGFWVYD